MKTGFKLFTQKDMVEADLKVCKAFLDNFVEKTLADPKKRYMGKTGGGYTSGLWRGRFGLQIEFWPEFSQTTKPIVFRRISKNLRHFACVYVDNLVVKNDKYLDAAHTVYRDIQPDGPVTSKMCKCPRHKGSIKVDWLIKPEFELYYEYGDAKG